MTEDLKCPNCGKVLGCRRTLNNHIENNVCRKKSKFIQDSLDQPQPMEIDTLVHESNLDPIQKIPGPAKRGNISKALRSAVFGRYQLSFDQAYCYVGCGGKLDPFNFECGHVSSCKEGGETTLDNLRPICERCNRSMGAKNMYLFVKECGFTLQSPLYGYPPNKPPPSVCSTESVIFP